ncbi:carboxymuconolactone decarboxylase family protein [Paracoccus albus]|uniref:carboxymuconolactone decarboxylase family protein n=1 Tax=Paracoccus albus TaxID=3017784 RepID=UPI0022F00B60|nr:carboxymuconolactone decarboxylase family protein [Paracoccus albus]WBU60572.1 carboxymuconolactone decarboxylase family protein [Paracoccus albus]
MKKTIAITALSLSVAGGAHAQQVPDTVAQVAPALQSYMANDLYGLVWSDEALSRRDRSLVTIAALVTRHEPEDLPAQVEAALDAGLTGAEISEALSHLAFYTGMGNATAAAAAIAPVFTARGITAEDLPVADPELLPLDEEADDARAERLQGLYGNVSQGTLDNTTNLLFRDLWLRPALAPRDRSLVTVAALIAAGQPEQMTFHLNRAMDNGLTQEEAGAVLSHLAFYTGWPKVFSALPVAKDVFEDRAE